ncbi:hypothetical protein OC834_005865 [Tilletia horrida]|nr:hypothetical protein OC834_005865 [Tilletia horrida]
MSYGGPPRRGGSSRTTLFVAGFPPDMRAKDLAYEFERMGPLVRCDIPAIRNPNAKPPGTSPTVGGLEPIPDPLRLALSRRIVLLAFELLCCGQTPDSDGGGRYDAFTISVSAFVTSVAGWLNPRFFVPAPSPSDPLPRCDRRSNRYAFVEYEDPRDAEEAHRRMHNMRFGEYTIGIQFAKAAPSSSWRYDGGGRQPPPRARSPPRRHDDYRRDDRDRDYRRDDRDRDRDYRRDDRRGGDDRDRDYRRDDRRDDRDRDRGGSSRPRSLSPARRPASRSPAPRDNGDRDASRPPMDEDRTAENGVNGGDEDGKTGWE